MLKGVKGHVDWYTKHRYRELLVRFCDLKLGAVFGTAYKQRFRDVIEADTRTLAFL